MNLPPRRAVVFAYHQVGVRGLAVLLALGIDVPLVITHADDPDENIWFDSVSQLAAWHGIPTLTPDNPNRPEIVAQISESAPDWIFSFYYRHMLGNEILQLATQGAYNLHGSLLPRYRGRVPVNWAVLHGETETGVSLHRMEARPDAGALLGQHAVSILPNDTAHQVFGKIVCAGEQLLLEQVPRLRAGTAVETPLDLATGSYFSGRHPEDGQIDWSAGTWEIHNLIRAVAPPYPGAFFDWGNQRISVLGSYWKNESARGKGPRLYWEDGQCYFDGSDGRRLLLTRLQWQGREIDKTGFIQCFGDAVVHLS